MSEKRGEDPLSTLLRAGDPAADDPGLDPDERAAMRRRVLAIVSDRRHRMAGWLLPAATAVTLLALALGLGWRASEPPAPGRLAARPGPSLATRPAGHQIQFTTESGTLVVWVLQPRPLG